MLTLVTGGARSGKSRHAESLVSHAPRVLYIATAQIFDEEMAARIAHHRQSRPAHWRTEERWQQISNIITAHNDPDEAIVLECITTLVTNLLFAFGGSDDAEGWDYAAQEAQVQQEIEMLIAACNACPSRVVMVTMKLEWGSCRKSVWRGIFVILPDALISGLHRQPMRSGWWFRELE